MTTRLGLIKEITLYIASCCCKSSQYIFSQVHQVLEGLLLPVESPHEAARLSPSPPRPAAEPQGPASGQGGKIMLQTGIFRNSVVLPDLVSTRLKPRLIYIL